MNENTRFDTQMFLIGHIIHDLFNDIQTKVDKWQCSKFGSEVVN
jgi:hypothetical protein